MKWSPVDPETVGQFTGLYDKNGKEIYEGDILKLGGSRQECENDIVIIGNIHDAQIFKDE